MKYIFKSKLFQRHSLVVLPVSFFTLLAGLAQSVYQPPTLSRVQAVPSLFPGGKANGAWRYPSTLS